MVIVGSGFGGLFAAKKLRRADVDVTLISKTAHHLFQPLLYQVATGILSEGEVAPATREILRRQRNARVVLGEVVGLDLAAQTITSELDGKATSTRYDSLVLATGAQTCYFGHDSFAPDAPGLKTVEDALELRRRIFGAFERAEVEPDPDAQERLMTFVVVGAGATGVELAGQINELARRTLRRDFRNLDPTGARVILVDQSETVLNKYVGDKLGRKAQQRLERMGVVVRTSTTVLDVDPQAVTLRTSDGDLATIPSGCVVWAAGVEASPLARAVAEQSPAELDRAGRVRVQDDLTVPEHPEVFVIGDLMAVDGVPGVAQGAIQSGRYAARVITSRVEGGAPPKPFHYFDKGNMAAISRSSAVVDAFGIRLSGFLAWLMWLAVHLFYLIGFRNRVTTLLHWMVSFIGRGRAHRAIARPLPSPVHAGDEELGELGHRHGDETDDERGRGDTPVARGLRADRVAVAIAGPAVQEHPEAQWQGGRRADQ